MECISAAGWAKTGLRPWNPDRVLRDLEPPPRRKVPSPLPTIDPALLSTYDEIVKTPVTAEAFQSLRLDIERKTVHADPEVKHLLEKLGNAGENTLAERSLLLDENLSVIEQSRINDRRKGRNLELGLGKVMSWEDLQAERRRKDREAVKKSRPRQRAGRRGKCRTLEEEKRDAQDEIARSELRDYCHVF